MVIYCIFLCAEPQTPFGVLLGIFGDLSQDNALILSRTKIKSAASLSLLLIWVQRPDIRHILTCIDVRHYFGLVFGTHHPAWQEE